MISLAIRRILVVGMLLFTMVPVGHANGAIVTYYISTFGNDLNPGTIDQPWRTFQQSLPKLHPGATLVARGGRYFENVVNPGILPGLEAARITVARYPGESPIIQGLLWLEGPSYWTFSGIQVTWNNANSPSQHMIKINNGIGWVYEYSEIWGATSFAAMLISSSKAGEPSNWTIRGNCVHNTYVANMVNQDHLLYVNSGPTGTGGLITRNLLLNSLNGMAVKLGGPTSTSPGPANVTVSYNTMRQNVHQVFVAWQAANNLFERNLVVLARQYDPPGNPAGVAVRKANFRGFSLTGPGNVVRNNAGHDGLINPPVLIQNTGTGIGLIDGGGNVYPVGDPLFDGSGCGGYHPQNPAAQPYGRFAP